MKYFVISDIHSHFKETWKALNEAGFEVNNKGHTLIVNGDVYDRGNQSQEIRDFLDSVNNKILIFGNHEYLMLEAINRGYFIMRDISNGTLDAAIQLSGGYLNYPRLVSNSVKEVFRVKDSFRGTLTNVNLQKEIIKNLINTNIVEWIVGNFYLEGSEVIWDKNKSGFKIQGKPRYYIQIEDRLITHGFFPAPDFEKVYATESGLKYFTLPKDYDLLEESSQAMWEVYGEGIWSNTFYWMKQFHKYKLTNLYDYIIRKNINHIYLGHWAKDDLYNMVVTVTMGPEYLKYHDRLPRLYFTDGTVVKSKKVLVETFETN